jgi:hypothetical protein
LWVPVGAVAWEWRFRYSDLKESRSHSRLLWDFKMWPDMWRAVIAVARR